MIHLRNLPKIAASLLAFAALSTSLHGAVIIGNLPSYTNSNSNSGIVGNGGTGKAIGFTMGSQSYELTSATLRLSLDSATNDIPLVQIWSADGTHTPNSLLYTFTNPAFTYNGSNANYVFSASSSFTLQSGTEYFLVVRNSGPVNSDPGGAFQWAAGSPTVLPSGSFATLTTPAIFGSGSPGGWASTSGNYNWMQIDGVAIPEPGSAALLGLGLAMVFWKARRRTPAPSL